MNGSFLAKVANSVNVIKHSYIYLIILKSVEDFYRRKHSGRKLRWYHHMSNGTITFANDVGRFDLDVTTFQIAVLFAWNERPKDKISFENLRLATELPDAELRRTLWVRSLAFSYFKSSNCVCS